MLNDKYMVKKSNKFENFEELFFAYFHFLREKTKKFTANGRNRCSAIQNIGTCRKTVDCDGSIAKYRDCQINKTIKAIKNIENIENIENI